MLEILIALLAIILAPTIFAAFFAAIGIIVIFSFIVLLFLFINILACKIVLQMMNREAQTHD